MNRGGCEALYSPEPIRQSVEPALSATALPVIVQTRHPALRLLASASNSRVGCGRGTCPMATIGQVPGNDAVASTGGAAVNRVALLHQREAA
jgi:hypothetical protein